MNAVNFESILHLIVIFGSILAIIYTFGVVWRVEKKLDISFKFFLASIIVFAIFSIVDFFSFFQEKTTELFLEIIFIFLFLFGILEMRSMLRKLDGEIGEKNKL